MWRGGGTGTGSDGGKGGRRTSLCCRVRSGLGWEVEVPLCLGWRVQFLWMMEHGGRIGLVLAGVGRHCHVLTVSELADAIV